MDDDWIKSPAARRILVHWADTRPAWLWSQDGSTLLWRNRAARYFGAKIKKSGFRPAPGPVPIKGQVARLIRLGSTGRSSLSRVQFLAGDRPASATTVVTPLEDWTGRPVALLVGVDPIAPELLAHSLEDGDDPPPLLPPGSTHVVLDPGGAVIEASPGAERLPPEGDVDHIVVAGRHLDITRYTASPNGHQLVLVHGDRPVAGGIAEARREEGIAIHDGDESTPTEASSDDPDSAVGDLPDSPAASEEAETEAAGGGRLSTLFDRLVDTDALYAGLPPPDRDEPAGPPEEPAVDAGPAPAAEPEAELPPPPSPTPEQPAAAPPDVIAAVIEFADDLENDRSGAVSYRITGRGFQPPARQQEAAIGERETDDIERASRYNFSELGRILSDRVSGDPPATGPIGTDDGLREPAPVVPAPERPALINIAAETFILNRLPIGILVLRDQQVLFANRALTDLLGHGSIDSLREAGLASVFPNEDMAAAGPVTHLLRKDGTAMPVTARLQSITWQGRPALLLSAMNAEHRTTHDALVRDFATQLATLRGDGHIVLDRAGTLSELSERAGELLGGVPLAGTPLAPLLDDSDARRLREFLERPARFAGTQRPAILLNTRERIGIALFADGMAGIVDGYFGLVGRIPEDIRETAFAGSEDPSMLARVSRGVRRPLNSIIGFADLIRSAAFGTIENHRYLEHARDIKTAGQEIAVLVDELDDYARLKAGTFAVRPADLDLSGLLESCVLRVRGQANAARVLVRSAVSEDLPHIQADRASLGQAVLNLLASAIDQTPPSGSVILSAQRDDADGIAINIRDSGEANVDHGERFVVFRDGVGKDGEALAPVRSSVGLALTRSLIAVNACALSVSAAGAVGTIFTVSIPAELIGPAAA